MEMSISNNLESNIRQRAKVDYNQGEIITDVAFVFACPGQEELKANKVVYGSTGKNLELLLQELKRINFPGINHDGENSVRYGYLITNASNRVYYKGYLQSKRTLPYALDIYSNDNKERLKKELNGKKIIVCFGKNAYKTISKIKKREGSLGWKVIESIHLGFQSINKKIAVTDEFNVKNSIEKVQARIRIIAENILKKYNEL